MQGSCHASAEWTKSYLVSYSTDGRNGHTIIKSQDQKQLAHMCVFVTERKYTNFAHLTNECANERN